MAPWHQRNPKATWLVLFGGPYKKKEANGESMLGTPPNVPPPKWFAEKNALLNEKGFLASHPQTWNPTQFLKTIFLQAPPGRFSAIGFLYVESREQELVITTVHDRSNCCIFPHDHDQRGTHESANPHSQTSYQRASSPICQRSPQRSPPL